MDNLRMILEDYLYFAIIFAMFIIILFIIILVFNKKKTSKDIYLYGLLMDLNNFQIFSLTLILINFLIMIYTLIMKINITIAFCIISFLLILVSFIIIKKYKYALINSGVNIINIALIYFANLVNTLRIENTDKIYLILQIVVNIFGTLFYIFSTCKFINNIRGKGIINEKVS